MSLDHARFAGSSYRAHLPDPADAAKQTALARCGPSIPYPYRSVPTPHRHHHRHFLDRDSFHLAYDCILGLPFRGSLAHVGVIGSGRSPEPTCVRGRGQGPADVRWTAPFDTLVVHAISSGYGEGNQARLIVNGVDYSMNCRGINMVLIDPCTFDVRSAYFDTHSYAGDGNASLQQFAVEIIRRHGWVFALAVKDDAASNLAPDSRVALESLGVNFAPHDDAASLQRIMAERQHVLPPREASILINLAACMDASRCIEVLAQYGWNVNVHAVTGLQNTPLHDAIRRGNRPAARTLLALGADATLFNRDRQSADDLARALHKAPTAIDYARAESSDEVDLEQRICRELNL